jgi:CDP-glucose 4,6-dehydratase
VHGFALDPPTTPSFHEACGVAGIVADDRRGDLRDPAALDDCLAAARPEVVFHLAAQPLVRRSYREPLETFDANVMGTARLLEAARRCDAVRAVVVVTTDKVYDNREWDWAYRETEPLGGADPYSASKACAELVCESYRRSFLAAGGIRLATARAGNVIGGGDWAADRLVPDFLRAVTAGEPLAIRAPRSVRPWQHVLEPLAGYLLLAERLLESDRFAEAWNFGPAEDDARPVGDVVDELCRLVPGARWHRDGADHPHEAGMLRLDSTKARQRLGWRPRWGLEEALARTIDWHRAWQGGADMAAVSLAQIEAFETAAAAARREAA